MDIAQQAEAAVGLGPPLIRKTLGSQPETRMKVFISHSSKDKWAARRISEDIEAIGPKTFLDEKDLSTGDSLDHEIKKHLTECEHFLLLLSPVSLKSEWVLLELGGALALGKHVVPILLYVGANEIPKAISLKLARDINDVGRYYDELRMALGVAVTKTAGPQTRAKAAPKTPGRPPLKVGDRVRVVATEPGDAYRDTGLSTFWVDEMNSYLGKAATVTGRIGGDYGLDVDGGRFAWVREWLISEA